MAKSKKVSDLCVAIATYKDENGQDKTQYENIGVEMEHENGGRFLLIKPYINLSGFDTAAGQMVLVSKFSIEKNEGEIHE